LRRFRYGTGVFKVDLALDGAAPWAAPELAETGVVYLTGDLDAMAEGAHEADANGGTAARGRSQPRSRRRTHTVDRDPRPPRAAPDGVLGGIQRRLSGRRHAAPGGPRSRAPSAGGGQ